MTVRASAAVSAALVLSAAAGAPQRPTPESYDGAARFDEDGGYIPTGPYRPPVRLRWRPEPEPEEESAPPSEAGEGKKRVGRRNWTSVHRRLRRAVARAAPPAAAEDDNFVELPPPRRWTARKKPPGALVRRGDWFVDPMQAGRKIAHRAAKWAKFRDTLPKEEIVLFAALWLAAGQPPLDQTLHDSKFDWRTLQPERVRQNLAEFFEDPAAKETKALPRPPAQLRARASLKEAAQRLMAKSRQFALLAEAKPAAFAAAGFEAAFNGDCMQDVARCLLADRYDCLRLALLFAPKLVEQGRDPALMHAAVAFLKLHGGNARWAARLRPPPPAAGGTLPALLQKAELVSLKEGEEGFSGKGASEKTGP